MFRNLDVVGCMVVWLLAIGFIGFIVILVVSVERERAKLPQSPDALVQQFNGCIEGEVFSREECLFITYGECR